MKGARKKKCQKLKDGQLVAMQCRLVTNLFFIIFELSATPPTSPIRSRTTPSENDAGGIQHEVRHLVAGRPGAGQGPPSSRLFNMQKTFSVLYQRINHEKIHHMLLLTEQE